MFLPRSITFNKAALLEEGNALTTVPFSLDVLTFLGVMFLPVYCWSNVSLRSNVLYPVSVGGSVIQRDNS